jgi:hypothetical protein
MSVDIWPSTAQLGFPVRIHLAADIGPARALGDVENDIIHDTEGTFPGDEIELTRLDDKIASAHALIGTTPAQGIVAMVPLNKTAWTPGNDYWARKSINIEISGYESKGYTDWQYQATAAYHKWAVAQGCPIPAVYIGRSGDLPGVLGHQDVPNPFGPGYGGASGHTDPGPRFEWQKFIGLCKGASIMPTIDLPYGGKFTQDGMLVFNPTGTQALQPIAFGFLEFFLTLGRNAPLDKSPDRIFNAVRLFGLPTEAAHTDPDGKTRQRFERYKFTFDPKGIYGWELYGEFV